MDSTLNDTLRNSTGVALTIEQYEFQEFLKDDIAVVVYLILLCFVGTIGNGHAFIVYHVRYKPSNHRTFVVWLAAIDFVACAVSAPFEIVDIRHGYTFDSGAACKCFRFINHVVSIASGLMLGVIAIERYRKACCPFGRQISEKEAAIACMVTVGVSILLAISSFYLYDVAEKLTDIPGLSGTDCTTGSSEGQQSFFRIYSLLLLLISTVIFIICIVAYSFVGKSLYKQMTFRQSAQLKNVKKTLSGNSISSDNKMTASSVHMKMVPLKQEGSSSHHIQDEESSVYSNKNKITRNTVDKPSSKPLMQGKAKLDRTRRITLMFLIATAVSYVGYLPNLIILVIRAVRPSAYENLARSLGMFTSVLLRGYFLSNVTNPLVYCFVDDRFRKECNLLYSKVFKLPSKWKSQTV
ncbi:cholecystokinin receptor type A-like [Saccostrea cucullata]|uniref:cholecystokinin receptor type A-like n=1 Tax=Saccostrea cuccullata TaxID=36930 RepID=UPI002ED4702A